MSARNIIESGSPKIKQAGGMQAGALCERILAGLGQEVVLVGVGGEIVYANRAARETLSIVGDGGNVDQVLTTLDKRWKGRLRNAAQSSALVPINLRVKSGEYSGMEMKFRARGMRSPDDGTALLMLLADRERDAGFTQLRQLVRDLNSELAQRKELQGRLEDALESEQRLHGELIHRVKNNLTLLNSLIHHRQKNSDNPEVVEALEVLEHRVHAILAVHNLLDRAGEIDWVDAGDLITELCEQLERSLARDNVRINAELLGVKLHVRDATPLSLLLNELITNAMKHAFPDGQGGTVNVELMKNGHDKLEVRVADDGRGVVDDTRKGSGSRIVQALARQIKGKLERHSDGEGTRWTFIFPHRTEDNVEEIQIGRPSMPT